MYERTYNSRVLKTDEKPSTRKKARVSWKRITVITSIIAVGVGLVLLLRAPKLQVKAVHVDGTNVADPFDIGEYALNMLDGYYLWILPKTSIFLVHNEAIAAAIKEAFPRLKDVVVDRDGMSSLRVTVTEYPGVYLWCDDACAFMDETGTVFADAPYFSGSAYLKLYIGAREQYPFTPITAEQVAMVNLLKERLEKIDIVSLSMRFESDHKLSVYVAHFTHESVIYFDPSEDIEEQLETLYSALRTDAVSRQYHDQSKVLQYLDARFANKLIYKFQ